MPNIKLNENQRKLVEDNIKLVYYVVNNTRLYSNDPSMDKEDFLQIGYLGLVNAALYYDNSKYKCFSSYAIISIKNSILFTLKKLNNFNKKITPTILDNIDGDGLSLLNFIEDESSSLEIENISSLNNAKELDNNIKNRINNLKMRRKTKDSFLEIYNLLLYYYERDQKLTDEIISSKISNKVSRSYINKIHRRLKSIALEEYIKLNK